MEYVVKITQVLTLEKVICAKDLNDAVSIGEDILNINQVPYSEYELETATISAEEKVEMGKVVSFPKQMLNN